MNDTEIQESPPPEEEHVLCMRCCRPVPPNTYYCPYCGHVVNPLTPYLPFRSVPFLAGAYVDGLRSMPSVIKLILLLLTLITFAPLLPFILMGILVKLVFSAWRKKDAENT